MNVRVEYGSHVAYIELMAVPRVGEFVRCAFPKSIGDEEFCNVVTHVYHRPVEVTVVVSDPKDELHSVQNREAWKQVHARWTGKASPEPRPPDET